MASLTKKVIHGRPYYYLRETARVGGRPKVVRTVYLGRAEDILARLEQASEPLRAGSRSFGSGGGVHHAGGDHPGRLRPLEARLRRLVCPDRACPACPPARRSAHLAALLGG